MAWFYAPGPWRLEGCHGARCPSRGSTAGQSLGAWIGRHRQHGLQSVKPIRSARPPLPDLSDDFATAIRPIWEWNHAPRADAFSLTERPGWLRMKAFRPAFAGLRGVGNMLTQRSWRTGRTIAPASFSTCRGWSMDRRRDWATSRTAAWIGVRHAGGRRTLCFGRADQVQEGPAIDTRLIALATRWTDDGRAVFEHDGGRGVHPLRRRITG
ncbi:hypothetical protein AB5I41_27640 [Sphingomonas sp. MMS24-JH45]